VQETVGDEVDHACRSEQLEHEHDERRVALPEACATSPAARRIVCMVREHCDPFLIDAGRSAVASNRQKAEVD
jgi:hypothetical protein